MWFGLFPVKIWRNSLFDMVFSGKSTNYQFVICWSDLRICHLLTLLHICTADSLPLSPFSLSPFSLSLFLSLFSLLFSLFPSLSLLSFSLLVTEAVKGKKARFQAYIDIFYFDALQICRQRNTWLQWERTSNKNSLFHALYATQININQNI